MRQIFTQIVFPQTIVLFSPCAEVCNDPSIAFSVPLPLSPKQLIAPALNTQVTWRTPWAADALWVCMNSDRHDLTHDFMPRHPGQHRLRQFTVYQM